MNNKKVLIEKSLSTLEYVKETRNLSDGRKVLGKLKGIGADFTKPTRNDRKYNLKLWRNVEKSEDFQEMMETLTCFGEADHPETRADTSIKEIAMVLTLFEIRESEGIVYTEFDILDTPNGRILKELLDYGCKIGVSSRGIGDEIVVNGETIIDPDTYIFFGFDAVVMPAVKSARPEAVLESSGYKNLSESIERELKSATTKYEVESIGRVLDSVLPDNDSIKESINKKLSEFNSGEDISDNNDSNLEELEDLKNEVRNLRRKLSAKNIRLEKLTSILNKKSSDSNELSKKLRESIIENYRLQDSVIDGVNQIEDISKQFERTKSIHNEAIQDLKKSNRSLQRKISILESSRKDLSEKLELEKERSSNYNSEVIDSLNDYKRRNSYLEKKNRNLEEQLSLLKNNSKRTENSLKESISINERKMRTKIDNINRSANKKLYESLMKYLEVKCSQMGLKASTVKGLLPTTFTHEDVDRVVKELSDRKARLNKVPISIQPRKVILSESLSNESPEDRQTRKFLESFNNIK